MAGKHAMAAKPGKTCYPCRMREKIVAAVNRLKKCNRCTGKSISRAREKMSFLLGVKKHAAGRVSAAMRRRTRTG